MTRKLLSVLMLLAFVAGGALAVVGGILAWLIMRGATSQSDAASQTASEVMTVNIIEE